MEHSKFSSGYVLYLALGIILALTITITALMKVPGSVVMFSGKTLDFVKGVYLAESAILSWKENLPAGYFQELPAVSVESFGPWEKICSPIKAKEDFYENLCVIVGSTLKPQSFGQWLKNGEAYIRSLGQQLESSSKSKIRSGNVRFLRAEEVKSLVVQNGDLKLHFDGKVPSASFFVEGNVSVDGFADFDTLRIYSTGDVSVGGHVHVAYGEFAFKGNGNFYGNSQISGVVVSYGSISFMDKSKCKYPCVALSLGVGEAQGRILNDAFVQGVFLVPAGTSDFASASSLDSSRVILPYGWGGNPVVWRRLVE